MAFWTEPRFTAGFAIRLLSILREKQSSYFTLEELTERALGLLKMDGRPTPESRDFRWWRDFADKLLMDFAALGLVRMEKGERPMYRGILGNGPPEGGGRGDDGDGASAGGDGGSGMSEVLANRVLFALDDEAFDAAIQRSLEAY